MEFDTWLNGNLGRGDSKSNALIPYPPHSIYGQCVTAASSWSLAQGGPELLGATAWTIYQNFRHPFYQVIPRELGTALQPGDILFYAPNDPRVGTGPDGHVDVFERMTGATSFLGADMDWDGSQVLQMEAHNINSVAGLFRPVGGNEVTQEQYQALMEELAESKARQVDLKAWMLNIYQVLAGHVPLDQLSSNVVAMLIDIKDWELDIDKDVKGAK